MEHAALVVLIVVIFFVAFPLFWVGMVFLISRLSGWGRLARSFAAERPVSGDVFNWCSARFGLFTNYSHCLTITVADDAIHMQPLALFKFGHAPLLIPRRAVTYRRSSFFFMPRSELQIRTSDGAWPLRITLYGKRLTDRLEVWAKQTAG